MLLKLWSCILLWSILVVQSIQLEPLNNRPILGVLVRDSDDHTHHTFSASYVKYLESAGARVIPIFINQPRQYYEHLVNQINGILFPGGSISTINSDYGRTADLLLDLAIAKNHAGIYFPVWGTCWGFQKLVAYFTGNREETISKCAAPVSGVALKLDILPGVNETSSKIFQSENGKHIIEILTTHPTTPNYHKYCVDTSHFLSTKNLTDQFRIISTNTYGGGSFVSTIEHRKYPIYGTQWHPEMIQFEWMIDNGINIGNHIHTWNAIQVGQYFANFLVNEARRNLQHFENKTEEAEKLIYNFNRYKVYTGVEKGGFYNEVYKIPFNFM